MNIQSISGGVSNDIYLIEGKSILRIYGQSRNDLIDEDNELKIVRHLGHQHKIAPKILFEFIGGRLEEYIDNCRNLNIEDLQDEKFRNKLLKKLKLIHNTEINNLDKTPLLIKNINEWTDKAKQVNLHHEFDDLFKLKDFLIDQLNHFKKETLGIKLCHNDLQKNNILVSNKKMRLIDFEYAGYNFVEFEIANFLSELNFTYNDTDFEYVDNRNDELYKQICNEYAYDEIEGIKLYNNITFFMVCSHYLWIMWAIIKNHIENNSFKYIKYAQYRLNLLKNIHSW
ncbi:euykaryotic ethanolamine kinase [Fadolivirus algeromassiliense]|jgi:choline kinase|uniref:Euykaryotic ethanolamine kinase n=1 Tax=Fadolivirus FV1/VV64 TaxID=3070911 RepID=A0A7D3UQ96_9VIRU|nr:euykaryotic ethanolamine kinase [Fadolivirus algeromassiliense]QKF93593.1 euykaryotic ethanolamine kinase [Fadolivirus FV1/VV64]